MPKHYVTFLNWRWIFALKPLIVQIIGMQSFTKIFLILYIFQRGHLTKLALFLSILNLCWWFFAPNFANFVQTTWNFNHINNVVTKIKYLRNKASKQVFIKLEAFKHWYLFLVILSFCKSDLHPEDEEVTKIWCKNFWTRI